MLEKYMLTNRGFRNVSEGGKVTGFQLKVRVPYYRGVFLCMVDDFRVTVDGEFFGPEKIKLSFGGSTYTMEDLKSVTEILWAFRGMGDVDCEQAGRVATRHPHG